MKRTTFFDHYRLAKEYDGSPVEIGRIGAAVIYKASDLRSGAPVAVTLLPVSSVDPAQRERFEENARAALSLDHINIVRTVEFGREEDDYAFVSEYPPGETLAYWVVENGPMSADAVLRVALQVVSALSSASFNRIHHRGIEPSNIMIVSGQTAEGGWPAVKLMNFAIAGLPAVREDVADTNPFASPEQLDQGRVDFRSEIYSLGATMCFLLTGAFYAAEPRSLQTKRFAPPLRRLIAPMLRQNPDERPQDPVMVADELHACLQRVERRQAWSRRFGIPFTPVGVRPVRRSRMPAHQPKSILAAAIGRPPEPVVAAEPVVRPRHVWLRRTLIAAAVLLAAATVAAMLLPAPVSLILHKHRDIDTIGVPVGVPEVTVAAGVSPAKWQNAAGTAASTEGAVANSAPHTSMPAPSNPAPPNTLPPPPSNNVAQNSLPLAPNNAGGHLTNSAPHMAMPIASASAPTASAATVASNISSSSTRGPGRSEAAPSPAVSSNAILPNSAATRAATPASVTAQTASPSSGSSPTHQVATNESASQPPPPAEGPQSVWERMAGDAGHTRMARTEPTKTSPEENDTGQTGDSVNDQSAAAADENESGAAAPKTSSHKTKTASAGGATTRKNTAAKRRSSTAAQRDEVESQNRSDYAPPHPRRRLRAQFAGRTPDGSIVVRFPNGETAIVPPPPGQYIPAQHRYYRQRRPVIYEPRDVSEAPYQPFLGPGD